MASQSTSESRGWESYDSTSNLVNQGQPKHKYYGKFEQSDDFGVIIYS
jgi:hypothetical protein